MLTTLACLALSMTTAAGILAWIDPSPSPTTAGANPQLVLAQVRSLLTEVLPAEGVAGRGVRVLATPPAGAGGLLQAQSAQPDVHFTIDDAGRVACAAHTWPRSGDDVASHWRIAVAASSSEGPMTTAQWQSLQALILALGERTPTAGSQAAVLPVQLDPTWCRVYEVDRDAVFQVPALAAK